MNTNQSIIDDDGSQSSYKMLLETPKGSSQKRSLDEVVKPNKEELTNKIVQGQYPANLSHCIFAQIEVMIIYPRRKNCSQH